ncbi:MAG: glutamyl-Q tRNA(Asp) synthetase [Pirellulaceae bacterium]|nr:MAG: glutamyl-Q tRNA(Asp) synthetase [Pirellulaceae bacterium]
MAAATEERPAVIGRLAPSPTGALHVGNARSFLLAWLSARQQGGQVLLRIEDIDSPRVKPWAVAETLRDFEWLGLDWDLTPEQSGPDAAEASEAGEPRGLIHTDKGSIDERVVAGKGTPTGVVVQTNRLHRYAQVLQVLTSKRWLYPCTCTRSDIAAAASAPHEQGMVPLEGVIYPGTCRQRSGKESTAAECAWRFSMPDRHCVWHDGVYGRQEAQLAQQLGDFVVAKRDHTPAYQLAVVVDDHDFGITEVVRGADLIPSTFRQLMLLEALEWRAPKYFHVPLIVGSDGRRLAKRHGDTRLSTLREQGVAPEALVGYLAWTLGMVPTRAPCHPWELVGKLNWAEIPREPTVFAVKEELPLLKRASRRRRSRG